jgi:hypothetical protein
LEIKGRGEQEWESKGQSSTHIYVGSFPFASHFPAGWTGLDALYRIVPGELSVVTGVPNSGKSEWLDALLCNLVQQRGWNFALCSMENKVGKTPLFQLLGSCDRGWRFLCSGAWKYRSGDLMQSRMPVGLDRCFLLHGEQGGKAPASNCWVLGRSLVIFWGVDGGNSFCWGGALLVQRG